MFLISIQVLGKHTHQNTHRLLILIMWFALSYTNSADETNGLLLCFCTMIVVHIFVYYCSPYAAMHTAPGCSYYCAVHCWLLVPPMFTTFPTPFSPYFGSSQWASGLKKELCTHVPKRVTGPFLISLLVHAFHRSPSEAVAFLTGWSHPTPNCWLAQGYGATATGAVPGIW